MKVGDLVRPNHPMHGDMSKPLVVIKMEKPKGDGTWVTLYPKQCHPDHSGWMNAKFYEVVS